MTHLGTPALEFETDADALAVLRRHGIREERNGIIRGNWNAIGSECQAAVQYLCDEWDFAFEQTDLGVVMPSEDEVVSALKRIERPTTADRLCAELTKTHPVKGVQLAIQRAMSAGRIHVAKDWRIDLPTISAS